MIYHNLEDIKATMQKEGLMFVRVLSNKQTLYAQNQKISPAEAAEKLEDHLNGLTGSGDIEINLYVKNQMETAGKGGNIAPVYSFNYRVGDKRSRDNGVGSINSAPALSREKELMDRIESLKEKIHEYEMDKRIRDIVDPLKKKIAGLEEEEKPDGGLGEIIEMAKPYIPTIMSKFFGTPVSSPALNEDVSEQRVSDDDPIATTAGYKEYLLQCKVDDAAEQLVEMFGVEKIAELFEILAEKAKADKVKFESYFPILKNL